MWEGFPPPTVGTFLATLSFLHPNLIANVVRTAIMYNNNNPIVLLQLFSSNWNPFKDLFYDVHIYCMIYFVSFRFFYHADIKSNHTEKKSIYLREIGTNKTLQPACILLLAKVYCVLELAFGI